MARLTPPTVMDGAQGFYNETWHTLSSQWQSLGKLEVIGLVRMAPVMIVKVSKPPEPTFTKVVIPLAS